MIEINLKVIGADCFNVIKIIKNLNKVERVLNIPLNIEKISSSEKEKYNVRVIPTLIIENKIVSEGNVIHERNLKNIIKMNAEV